jgi:ankyrin repeat protein
MLVKSASWKRLLRNGANVNARIDGWGRTPLMLAAQNGHTQSVKLLISRGAYINAKLWGTTALMDAAEAGHIEVVRVLLSSGADVNAKSRDGKTALLRAVSKGQSEIVQLLQRAGDKE